MVGYTCAAAGVWRSEVSGQLAGVSFCVFTKWVLGIELIRFDHRMSLPEEPPLQSKIVVFKLW